MDEIHKENPNEASEKALRRWQKDKMNVAIIGSNWPRFKDGHLVN